VGLTLTPLETVFINKNHPSLTRNLSTLSICSFAVPDGFQDPRSLLVSSKHLINADHFVEITFPHQLKDQNQFFFEDGSANSNGCESSAISRRTMILNDVYHLIEANSFIR
jgi:hypothetical protein